jgi:hypothetical protein
MGGGQAFVVDDFSLTVQYAAAPRFASISVVTPGGARKIGAYGETNRVYMLQAAPGLLTPVVWTNVVSTNGNATGVFEFTDPGAVAPRVYRLYPP